MAIGGLIGLLEGVTAERELSIVKQIALGSIRNKLIFILPVGN